MINEIFHVFMQALMIAGFVFVMMLVKEYGKITSQRIDGNNIYWRLF